MAAPRREAWIGLSLLLLLPNCSNDASPTSPGTAWMWDDLGVPAEVRQVAVTFDGTIFVGASDGAYRSDDDGRSWLFLSSPWSLRYSRAVLDLDTSPSGTTLCATAAGTYATRDAGETWTHAFFRRLDGDTTRVEAVAASPGGLLFAAMGNDGGGFFRSSDHGSSWESRFYFSDPDPDLRFDIQYISAFNPSLVFFGFTRIGADWVSKNDGDSWNGCFFTPGVNFNQPQTLGIVSDGLGSILAFNGETIFASADDGDTWGKVRTGSSFTALASGAPGAIYAGTAEGEVLRSLDSGKEWTSLDPGPGQAILALAVGPSGAIYAAVAPAGVPAGKLLKGTPKP